MTSKPAIKWIRCILFLSALVFSAELSHAQSRDIRSHAQYGASEGDLRLKFEFYHDMWSERDVKHGKYSEWVSNDRLKLEGFFFDGKQDSVWQYFFMNGQLSEQSNWENGLRNGRTSLFDKKGKLLFEHNYVQGIQEGLSMEFFKNGRVKRIAQYHRNRLHGNVTTYSRKGIRKAILLYEEGKRVRARKERKRNKDDAMEPDLKSSDTGLKQNKTSSKLKPSDSPRTEKGKGQAWEHNGKQNTAERKAKRKAKANKPE